MASKNKSYSKNTQGIKKSTSRVKSEDVLVRILRDGTYKVTGTVTRKVYIFSGAGSTQLVDSKDMAYFRNKVQGHSCCGTGLGGQNIFEILGD